MQLNDIECNESKIAKMNYMFFFKVQTQKKNSVKMKGKKFLSVFFSFSDGKNSEKKSYLYFSQDEERTNTNEYILF